jgi:mannose-6-phosphate isomerase-like protein (cupin superfamily)
MSENGIYVVNIEKETVDNTYFRKVLNTSKNQQLVVMSIKPKKHIPYEIHPDNDQFIRIEKGHGELLAGPKKEFIRELLDGMCVTIPAGTWHEIRNTSDTVDLKLYTIYSPPHHPPNEIDINGPDDLATKPTKQSTKQPTKQPVENKIGSIFGGRKIFY